MPMLFGSALSFTTFVLVVVVARVSTLLIFSVLLYVWALGLGVMFKVYNGITRVQHEIPSDPTLSQKRAVFPAFSLLEVTLGQICKIGIHFIIYQGKVDLKTTSVTDNVIDWALPNNILGWATGKLKPVLSYYRASMTKSKSGQIV